MNEVAGKARFFSDIARRILYTGDPALPPSADWPQGEGQLVVVADSGFDNGSTTDIHPAFTGRVHKIYALRPSGLGNDTSSHGTMVAFSVLGDYQMLNGGPRITGMAPKAKLIVQALATDGYDAEGLPPRLSDLFMPPYQNDGARIHTNSWGHRGRSVYDRLAQEVDEFVYDQRDFICCFAAGNEALPGNGTGPLSATISSPGTAKNCITVGATENYRPAFTRSYAQKFDGLPPLIGGEAMANDIEAVAPFSSRGPGYGNRIKPDVVAPGTYILATRSRSEIFPAGIVWDTNDQDPLLLYGGGTSHATPLVAGAVAIIRGFVVDTLGIANPGAALIKALVINGARSVRGRYDVGEPGAGPNHVSGFGRVDVGAIVQRKTPPAELICQDERTMLDTGDEETTIFQAVMGISHVKVTLVWTDPPGPALQSDLDLIVSHSNGEERHGNMKAGSPDFDRENNVEQVCWEDIGPGLLTITVRAYRITSRPQNYALVIRSIL